MGWVGGARKNSRALNEGFIVERSSFVALVCLRELSHAKKPNVLGEETRLHNCRKWVKRFPLEGGGVNYIQV